MFVAQLVILNLTQYFQPLNIVIAIASSDVLIAYAELDYPPTPVLVCVWNIALSFFLL